MTDLVREDYRDAMACLGAAVSIVTTDGPAGLALQKSGLTENLIYFGRAYHALRARCS